ncbi:hypothetical protein GCM10028820_18630 [Tessaracoccus terricola]
MTSAAIVFDPNSYEKASSIIAEATTFIHNEIDNLVASVSDYKILGENDILGKIVNQLYRAFMEAFAEIVKGLVDGLLDQAQTLQMVGRLYKDTSDAAEALSALVGKDY